MKYNKSLKLTTNLNLKKNTKTKKSLDKEDNSSGFSSSSTEKASPKVKQEYDTEIKR